MANKFLTVAWGECADEDRIETYQFSTESERIAFIEGVNAALGWLDADYIEHNEPKKFKLNDFQNCEQLEV